MSNYQKIKIIFLKKWVMYLEWFQNTSTTIVILIFLFFLIPIIIWVDIQQIKSLKDFVRILLERGEVIAILSATLLYFKEARNRKKSEHYEAWQVINSAQNQGGSGGRINALEDLNRDQVSFLQEAVLVGANLEDTILMSANLEGAILSNANLKGADLRLANLKDAVLVSVNLEEATLTGAILTGAILTNSNLQNAILNKVNFTQAMLDSAKLKDAILDNSNFEGAELEDANLENTVLNKVNFTQANLCDVNFDYADLEGTNLVDAIDLSEEQLMKARICQTLLPSDFTINSNRDCDVKPGHFTKGDQELSENEQKQLLRLRKFIDIASQDGKISQDEMQTIQSLITSDHRINIQELKMLEELIDSKIEKGELDQE
jgi:uncharacterized protein YjbI with pentapeptide repeats